MPSRHAAAANLGYNHGKFERECPGRPARPAVLMRRVPRHV